jgi:hypothetical protein
MAKENTSNTNFKAEKLFKGAICASYEIHNGYPKSKTEVKDALKSDDLGDD